MIMEGNVSTVSIVEAGERILVKLMDSRECDTLNELCSTKFCQNLLKVRVLLVRKCYTAQKKWSFPSRISSVNVTKSAVSWGNPQSTFTEEILSGKLHFFAVLPPISDAFGLHNSKVYYTVRSMVRHLYFNCARLWLGKSNRNLPSIVMENPIAPQYIS